MATVKINGHETEITDSIANSIFNSKEEDDDKENRPHYGAAGGKQKALAWKNLILVIENRQRVTILKFQHRAAAIAYGRGCQFESISAAEYWKQVDKKNLQYFDVGQNPTTINENLIQ